MGIHRWRAVDGMISSRSGTGGRNGNDVPRPENTLTIDLAPPDGVGAAVVHQHTGPVRIALASGIISEQSGDSLAELIQSPPRRVLLPFEDKKVLLIVLAAMK